MAADLFETYAVTIVATMVLASIFFPNDYNLMIYPLAIGGACIITSIIGTWFVKLGKNKNIMGALYKGFIVTAITSLIILYPVTDSVVGLTENYSSGAKILMDWTYISAGLWFCDHRFINLDYRILYRNKL